MYMYALCIYSASAPHLHTVLWIVVGPHSIPYYVSLLLVPMRMRSAIFAEKAFTAFQSLPRAQGKVHTVSLRTPLILSSVVTSIDYSCTARSLWNKSLHGENHCHTRSKFGGVFSRLEFYASQKVWSVLNTLGGRNIVVQVVRSE